MRGPWYNEAAREFHGSFSCVTRAEMAVGIKWRPAPPSRSLNHGPSSVVASLETSISDESVVSRGERADAGVGQVGEMFHSIFRAIHKSPS